jgi:hypothetical protein
MCTTTWANWMLVWGFRRVFMLFSKPQSRPGNHRASESESMRIWVSSEPYKVERCICSAPLKGKSGFAVC